MKFSIKLVGFTTIIIALLFSIGGFVFVNNNFNHSLDYTVKQNTAQHIVERYSVESNFVNTILNTTELSDDDVKNIGNELTRYLGFIDRQIGIYKSSGQPVFTSIVPKISDEILNEAINSPNEYMIRKIGDENYMLISSPITISVTSFQVLSVYNMDGVFAERDRQIKSFILLDIAIILISVVFIVIFSLFLTAPIKRLNFISKKIANGAYSERAEIKATDEIGELGASFNSMAQAVENKIIALNTALTARDDFVASFSHELKTPMTAIIGYADVLRTMECDKEITIKSANYIFHESKRLQTLSLKLMNLMTLTDENVSLAPISAKKFFNQLFKDIKQTLGETILDANIEDKTVIAEEVLLDSLVRNLISNAKKSNPKDNKIVINGKMVDGKYQISVIDKGCGIQKEELPFVTEPFYMVDKVRARGTGGNGLGLFIAQKIAGFHHSTLEFESEAGIGTTVRFCLRCHDE